jgi:hypothetical protein
LKAFWVAEEEGVFSLQRAQAKFDTVAFRDSDSELQMFKVS